MKTRREPVRQEWRGHQLAAFLVLCLLALVVRANAGTLTVATYNVENYVATNRLIDGVYREAYPKPEAAKTALRAVIRGLDADVLALQEMGPAPYLEELRRDLAQEGVNYPHAALLEGTDPERHVAVLSRRPFTTVQKHADLTFAYFGQTEAVLRGLLEVRVATDAGEITLFVVHLKSRYTDRPDDPSSAARRAGEAMAVRDRVLKVFRKPGDAHFLIVGDCNDVANSRPLRALTQKGRTNIAEILPAADARGHAWTHWYKKEETYSRVDYILVSPGLRPAVVGGEARIFDAPETAAASDHRPVWVKLELN